MLTIISPAKSLDLTSPVPDREYTSPRMLDESERLIEVMRGKSLSEVAGLMHLSDELAALNVQRYQDFETPFTRANSRPALLTFAGDVYQGMAARARFDDEDFTEAERTLRILSGLYGLLRPLDLIQPYRLEMGVRLATERGRSLYEWWGDRITTRLAADLAESPGERVLVNLASHEYVSAVDLDALGGPAVSPRFEDQGPRGDWKVISFSAKRARGEMAAWLVRHRVRTAADLTAFDVAGYRFEPGLSSATVPVFRRRRA
ncbi:MAG TPA: peroxide stress protein YaaA [Propionibacteriaceae bacterium]|nr:peroxide stress protein YaaA [Propionibacteriaceae bacterium]